MVAERRSNNSAQLKSNKTSPQQPPKNAIDGDDDEENDDDVIDYASTADAFFSQGDDDNDDERQEENEDDSDEDEDNDDDEDDADDDSVLEHGDESESVHDEEDDDDDNDDKEDEESLDDDSETGKEDEDDVSVEEVDEKEDERGDAVVRAREQQKIANAGNKIVVAGTEEPCTFDLRNLFAISSYPIDSTKLYRRNGNQKNASTKHVIIPQSTVVNEEYLLQKSVEGCNQLITALWQLPVERSDAGPMVMLPTYDDSKIPRKLVRLHRFVSYRREHLKGSFIESVSLICISI